jgi:hypothetical protein
MAENTKVLRCSCQHDYQDETYGVGLRVHNLKMNGQYACTVCGTIRGAAQTIDEKKKK